MKNMKKALLILLCLAAIIGATIMGTLAWLTDEEFVKNTMTVGKVDITVDEADVDSNGNLESNNRVTGNTYHLIPGQRYTKDPTMTVLGDSEPAYVRMLLTLSYKSQLDNIFKPDGVELEKIFKGYNPAIWIFETETVDADQNTVTYEFRYNEIVATNTANMKLEPLFTEFEIPGTITGADLESIKNMTITVTGQAIQSAGFADENAAWEAFNAQINSN